MNFFQKWLMRRRGVKEYTSKLMSFISDQHLDANERAILGGIIKEYGLSPDHLLLPQKRAFSYVFDALAADDRVTVEEKKKIEEIASHFGRSLTELDFDQDRFNKAHMLAAIDSGTLPTVKLEGSIGVILKEGETLHWVCAAAMLKRKRVTTRVRYSGVSGSVKIMKGVRYRVGSFNVETRTSEFLEREDAGWLWLSNKRVGFKGPKKHFTIQYDKIGSFEIAEGALLIFKDGRENPYMLSLVDYDVPCSILSLILNPESSNGVTLVG